MTSKQEVVCGWKECMQKFEDSVDMNMHMLSKHMVLLDYGEYKMTRRVHSWGRRRQEQFAETQLPEAQVTYESFLSMGSPFLNNRNDHLTEGSSGSAPGPSVPQEISARTEESSRWRNGCTGNQRKRQWNANEEYDRSLTPTSPTPLPEQPEKEQDVQSPVAKSVAKEKKFDARPRNIGDYHETKPCRENLQLHLENPKRPSEQPSASEMNYSPDRQIAQPNVEEDLEENVDEEADDISDTQTTKPRQSLQQVKLSEVVDEFIERVNLVKRLGFIRQNRTIYCIVCLKYVKSRQDCNWQHNRHEERIAELYSKRYGGKSPNGKQQLLNDLIDMKNFLIQGEAEVQKIQKH